MIPKTLLKINRVIGLACFGFIPLLTVVLLVMLLLPIEWFTGEFWDGFFRFCDWAPYVALGAGCACSNIAWRGCMEHYAEHGTFAEDDDKSETNKPETK